MSAEAFLPTAPSAELLMADTVTTASDTTTSSTTTTTTDVGATAAAATEMEWEVLNDNADDATRVTTKPSSTAYSYTGDALGKESIENIKSNNINTSTDTKASHQQDEDKNEDSMFECNICLDTAKDAVVSMCGHLFCWPCLHQWLETRPQRKLCPVCKAAISREKVIPLYGRNSAKQEDPRNKVPPRPAGQRTEPEPQHGFPGFGFGDNFHMSFGIGSFPFGFFASTFNYGEQRPAAANRGTTQYEDEQNLSKLFLYLAFMCIVWLLFA